VKSIRHSITFFSILYLFILQGCFGPKNTKSTKTFKTTQKTNNSDTGVNNAKQSSPTHNSEPTKGIDDKTIEATKQKTEPVITVWIHGTRLVTQFAPQEFIFSPPGIRSVNEITDRYLIRKIAKKLSAIDPKRFQLENFYIFGWPGKLSFEARKQAAQELYNALNDLAKIYYEEHGIRPTFRIITHSHGGNVVLNLPKIKDAENNLTISELILLACPVQEKTKDAIKSPLFKRIYSFFSRGELLQILDPQGIYKGNKNTPLFSKRTFPSNPKLSQAQIKMLGRSILHVEFLLGHFMYKLPAMLDALDSEHIKEDSDNKEKDYFIIDLMKKHTRRKKYKRKHKILIIN